MAEKGRSAEGKISKPKDKKATKKQTPEEMIEGINPPVTKRGGWIGGRQRTR